MLMKIVALQAEKAFNIKQGILEVISR